jgi:sugar lactone lactonase YvrE
VSAWVRTAVAAVLVATGMSVPAAAVAQEAPEPLTLTTVAGSTGEGPARTVAQAPTDILVEGDTMLVADALWGVIRETDLTSGVQRVLYRHPSVPGALAAADPSTPFPYPMTIARARDGGLYISQRARHRVIKINPDGRAVEVAGDGRRGYLGDGGPATQASLAEPAGVAVDAVGRLLIADEANHAVRRVSLTGSIETVAGAPGPAEGCDAPGHQLWEHGSLCPVAGYAGDGGPAHRALLDRPGRVRVGRSGELYIGGGGDGDAGAPLRQVAPDGTISTLAGGGPREPYEFDWSRRCHDYTGSSNAYRIPVHDAAVLPSGELLVATGEECVHRLDPVRRVLHPFAGGAPSGSVDDDGDGGPATAGGLRHVRSLAVSADRALIAEPRYGRVRSVDAAGRLSTIAGATARSAFGDRSVLPNFAAGNGGPAASAQLPSTTGLAVAPTGAVYVADKLASVVRRIEPDGLSRSIVGHPAATGDIPGPMPAADAWLAGPDGIALTPDGSLYIADGGRAIRRLRTDGYLETIAGGDACKTDLGHGDPALGTELHNVSDVTAGVNGGLYLVETTTGHLRFIDPQGRMHILVGPRERPCSQAGEPVTWHHEGSPLAHATGVASAPDGSVWVTTPFCLNRVSTAGAVECVVDLTPHNDDYDRNVAFPGYPSAARPDVVVDPAGVVTFTDPGGHAVRRRAVDGSVTTLAGNGTNGCSPSGGPATTAALAVPTQLALAPDGSVLVADVACRTVHRVGRPQTETVTRAAGPDRLATAVHASRSGFAAGTAGAVVLARADDYADALTGTPLAVRHRGPLLLTPSGQLAAWPESELRRVLPRGGTVYLLGGEAALGPKVAARVQQLGYTVTRLAGRDRYATAVAVAERGLGAPGGVLLTTGLGFADALGAAVAAAEIDAAVLLTAGDRPSAATVDYLRRHAVRQQYAIGGPAARAHPAASAVVGADRYATAVQVAARFFPQPPAVGLATGAGFADALSGGATIGALGGPLLLTGPTGLSVATRDYLGARRSAIRHVLVVGGEAAVSAKTRTAAVAATR